MSSSSTTTQLGRHVWSSIRDSVGVLASRVPLQQHRSLNRLGLSQGFIQPTTCSTTTRAFHTSKWFGLPNYATPSPRNVRRSYTSGGLLLIGLTSGPSSAPSVVVTCTAAAESSVIVSKGTKTSFSSLAQQAWRTTPHSRRAAAGKRSASSKPEGGPEKTVPQANSKPEPNEMPAAGQPTPEEQQHPDHESLANSMSKYLHMPHLPKMPHRPTKEELLSAASGFWERLKVRFKWHSIRSMRPWNADEWGAFVSWFLFGHLVWILVGTTTFFSLVILTINTVFAQGMLIIFSKTILLSDR